MNWNPPGKKDTDRSAVCVEQGKEGAAGKQNMSAKEQGSGAEEEGPLEGSSNAVQDTNLEIVRKCAVEVPMDITVICLIG